MVINLEFIGKDNVLKNILLVLLAIIVAVASSAYIVTLGKSPTHSVLAESDLPDFIPTYAFYADPRAAYGYHVSDDGELVALTQGSLRGLKLVVREVSSGKQIAELPSDIWHLRWHPSKQLLRFIHQAHDWEVDPYQSDRKSWRRISPVKLSMWRKLSLPTDDVSKILTLGNIHSRAQQHLYLVSQDGLTAEKVAEGEKQTVDWMIGNDLSPFIRVDTPDTKTFRLMARKGEAWDKLIDIDVLERFYQASDADTEGNIRVVSTRGRDKAAFVRFDANTGAETVIIDNPEEGVGDVYYLSNKYKPDIIRLGRLSAEYQALTEQGQIVLDILEEFPKPIELGHIGRTAGGRYTTLAISSQQKSWFYLVVDLENKTYKKLGEFAFSRYADELGESKPVLIPTRDGEELQSILAVPKNVNGPIPFIVHIHGGPNGLSELKYDHDMQFLLNRGYGVLQVNFRGSVGLGKEFQAKGFRQFGRKMQDDISDAAHWLVDQGLADPDALVVMGGSYGGYSAALAMTREPGLFDAAIVEIPMLDVEFQSKYHPGFWDNSIYSWQAYFGDIESPGDRALMRKYSPSNRIDDIHGPMLILAGQKDQITAVQQVRDFEEAAKKANKPVEVHYFPEAGHGFFRWQDKFKRARLIEDFLAEKAGGRTGGVDPVDWVLEYY